jgi:Glyoxalase-like domain
MAGSDVSRDRRPRVAVDHVLVALRDLTDSARRFEAAYGLSALPGGRHPRVGTANMIVPLGSAYLELIAVVDAEEAAQAPIGGRIARAVEEGRTFAMWAVRTDDLDGIREGLQTAGVELSDPFSGARQRPDGVTLRWRTQFLVPPGERTALPFIIQWLVPPRMHPAETAVHHASGARSIRLIRLGDPDPASAAERLRALLGEELPCVVEKATISGVLAVELDTPSGTMVIE